MKKTYVQPTMKMATVDLREFIAQSPLSLNIEDETVLPWDPSKGEQPEGWGSIW